jgi:hypothetical protein
MDMNLNHPDFDYAMELLAALPPEPGNVLMAHLAADLGFGAQREVRDLMDTLKERGFEIVIQRGPDTGLIAYIPTAAWPKAQAAGEAYWRKVYGSAHASTAAA